MSNSSESFNLIKNLKKPSDTAYTCALAEADVSKSTIIFNFLQNIQG